MEGRSSQDGPFFVIAEIILKFIFPTQGQFVDSYDPTIENSKSTPYDFQLNRTITILISFRPEHIVYNNGFLIAAFSKNTRINNFDYEVKLVDTAGQDEYSIFPAQYSMDFHGYVLVYSITSQKSFEVIKIIYSKLIDVMGKA